jgi:hypothetical protein
MIGNKRLKTATKTTTNNDYLAARADLVAVGLVHLGYGRGGSVGLVGRFTTSDGGEEPTTSGLELRLYSAVRDRLEADINAEARFSDCVVEITALQGRRRTGGIWSRPDITVVARRPFRVLAGAHLEVHTYEVKTASGLSIVSLHEARAQRRRAHRSYVVADLEQLDQQDRVQALIEDARDLGVGLVSFLSPEDESWDVWVEAEFNQPDPIDLDEFLFNQLTLRTRETVRAWAALPALGGD